MTSLTLGTGANAFIRGPGFLFPRIEFVIYQWNLFTRIHNWSCLTMPNVTQERETPSMPDCRREIRMRFTCTNKQEHLTYLQCKPCNRGRPDRFVVICRRKYISLHGGVFDRADQTERMAMAAASKICFHECAQSLNSTVMLLAARWTLPITVCWWCADTSVLVMVEAGTERWLTNSMSIRVFEYSTDWTDSERTVSYSWCHRVVLSAFDWSSLRFAMWWRHGCRRIRIAYRCRADTVRMIGTRYRRRLFLIRYFSNFASIDGVL